VLPICKILGLYLESAADETDRYWSGLPQTLYACSGVVPEVVTFSSHILTIPLFKHPAVPEGQFRNVRFVLWPAATFVKIMCVCLYIYIYIYIYIYTQGGSNMTGTNWDLFTHK
jgi:hypothetical protein